MNEALLISILAASITAGTPILFAALGELISERAGITNLGVDGMMLVGACARFYCCPADGQSGWRCGYGTGRRCADGADPCLSDHYSAG